MSPLAYIWKTSKVRIEIFSFTMVVGTLYIVYQCSILATSTLGLGSIQISGIVLGGAEFCTYFVVFIWAKHLKRKTWTMVCMLVILFGAATAFILGLFHFEYKDLIIAFILIFLCKVPVCVTYTFIFVYVSETFATNIRGTASGLIASIARFIGASSALVNLGIADYPNVQLVGPCALWGLLGLPMLMFYLKETHNQSTK
jgi:MFS family permease